MTNSANAARGRRQVVQLTQEEWLKSLQQQVVEQQKSKPPGRTDHQVGQKDDEEATNRAPVAPMVQVAGGRRRIVQQMTHEEYAKSLQEQIRLKECAKEDQIRQEPENMSLASHKEPTQTEGLPPVKGGRRRVQQLSRDEWLASIQQQMQQNEAKSATNSTEQTTQNESTNCLNSPRPNAEETDRIVRLQEAKSSEEQASHLSMEPDPTTHKEPEEPHGEPEEHPTRYVDNDDKDVDEKLLKAPKGKNTCKEVAKKENKGKTKERREVKGGSKGEDKGEIKKQESKGKAKPAKSAPKPTSRRKSASGNQRSPIKPLPSNQVGSPRQSELEASKLEHVVQAYEAIQRQNEELKRQLAEQGQVLQFIRENISAPPRETVTPAAPKPPNVVALTPKQQDKLPQKSKLIPPGKIATSIAKRQVHVKLPAVEPMKPMETRKNNQEPDEIEQCTRELEAPSPAKHSPKVAKDDHSPGPSSVNKLDAKCAQASPSRRRPSKPLKQRQRHDSSTARSSSDLSDMEPELSCSTVLLPALNVPSKSSKGFEPELESESIHVLRESSVMLPIRI